MYTLLPVSYTHLDVYKRQVLSQENIKILVTKSQVMTFKSTYRIIFLVDLRQKRVKSLRPLWKNLKVIFKVTLYPVYFISRDLGVRINEFKNSNGL